MLATGSVERVGRGLYRHTDSEPADYDLIEIAVKAHRPTLCLLSALARHELTDIIPSVHDIAVPRGAWQPLVSAPVHWQTSPPSILAKKSYALMRRTLSACTMHLAASSTPTGFGMRSDQTSQTRRYGAGCVMEVGRLI
jgi:hypothetical protein